SPTPIPTTHTTPNHDDEICDLLEEFRVSGPPPLSSPNPCSRSPSMEEDVMIYAGDLAYMSTPCPSPPSDVDDLYPYEDPKYTIILHLAFIDDDDINMINEDIYNFRYDHTLPRDA
uniref:Uncharacterized protein n=1 Tax=Oryza brachyantha TaxID=4533 RepID=J3LCX4_ORYBR